MRVSLAFCLLRRARCLGTPKKRQHAGDGVVVMLVRSPDRLNISNLRRRQMPGERGGGALSIGIAGEFVRKGYAIQLYAPGSQSLLQKLEFGFVTSILSGGPHVVEGFERRKALEEPSPASSRGRIVTRPVQENLNEQDVVYRRICPRGLIQ